MQRRSRAAALPASSVQEFVPPKEGSVSTCTRGQAHEYGSCWMHREFGMPEYRMTAEEVELQSSGASEHAAECRTSAERDLWSRPALAPLRPA